MDLSPETNCGEQPAADPVERLLAECLQEPGDAAAAVELACRRFPEHARALRARLRVLADIGFLGAAAAIPERLGGFRLLRRIGAGGMGIVYLAHEEALDRTVALKLIRPELLYFPDSRARFEREGKAVARLRHPGIVPVYSVGLAEGVPYFAMEYVAGVDLQDVLSALQDQAPERRTARDLVALLAARIPAATGPDLARSLGHGWPEVCVRLVLQAAAALHHVHAHGVLHRDVKPSNLMVTGEGRVVLLDFGIAASTSVGSITRSGIVAGSLPYMAPEQVRGQVLDARTDVYALGVTLFELLTGRNPHLGRDLEETRRRILAGALPPLRELNRAVTWDLETVCHKAMDRDPARRYPSAGALADDLAAVLEYRPIAARRPGPWLRLRRLAQRRPAAMVAALLGSVLLLGGPAGVAVLEHDAAARIAVQRLDAERSLAEALRAVHQMLTVVGGQRLRQVPQSNAVRRQLLDEALAFSQRLRATRPEHPGVRREVAAILVQSAIVQRGLGDVGDARRSLTEALSLLDALVAEGSDRRNDRESLAGAMRGMGNLLRDEGDLVQAESWMRRALACETALAQEQPADGEAERRVGEAQAALAEILVNRQDRVGAQAAAQAAVATLERCRARAGADPRVLQALVFARFSLGDVRHGAPGAEARDHLEHAVELARQLHRGAPDNFEYLELLAVAEGRLGILLVSSPTDDLKVTEGLVRGVLAHRERLAAAFPGWVDHHVQLGGARSNLATVLMRERQHQQAVPWLEQAIAAQRTALELQPGCTDAIDFLHTHRANLGRCLEALGRKSELLALTEPAAVPPASTAAHHMYVVELLCTTLRVCQDDVDLGEQVESLGQRAVASLEAAVALGMNDVARIRRGIYANVLRHRADYRALVARIRVESQPAK